MSYNKTYNQIQELILRTALETGMARDIVRRSGIWPGSGASLGIPVEVLSQGWIVEPWADLFVTYHENDRYGIFWSPDTFPESFEFWPTGEATYVSRVDLQGYVWMRNVVYVAPETPHPELNVRVEASVDGGGTWGLLAGDSSDWLYGGCNVNLGGWPEDVGSASGGCIASEWQQIKNEYRIPDVLLRWTFFTSPVSDSSVYDPAANEWGGLRFGYSSVQVS